MTSDIQNRLLQAVGACLRPLVRILIRSGISYHQFDEAVKLAFVNESLASGDQARKKTNVSRIAVRTGLSRKEVARLRNLIEFSEQGQIDEDGRRFHTNQAARVLQIWNTDPAFCDSSGKPMDLEFDSGERSFAGLVKMVGGDVPAGAVRAELLAASAVEELPEGRLRVLKRHFIPGDLDEELLVGFGHIATPLMITLAHNAASPKERAHLQRVAYSDSIPIDSLPKFRQFASEHAGEFVRSMDDWITANEDSRVQSAPQGSPRVGVGVFYFEQSDTDK